jgi:hypothetical protein
MPIEGPIAGVAIQAHWHRLTVVGRRGDHIDLLGTVVQRRGATRIAAWLGLKYADRDSQTRRYLDTSSDRCTRLACLTANAHTVARSMWRGRARRGGRWRRAF